jgi:hypothetical protein
MIPNGKDTKLVVFSFSLFSSSQKILPRSLYHHRYFNQGITQLHELSSDDQWR